MFSSRLAWDVRPNRLSEALARRRAGGAEIFDLTESNPTRAGLIHDANEILAAFDDPRILSYAPDPAGSPEARNAVAFYYANRNVRVDPGYVVLTTSTSESYSWLFKLLAGPGDRILAPSPSYPLFEFLASLESVTVTQYPLRYHGRWEVDFGALESLVDERTRAIVLVNPNNPTGSYLKRDEYERLTELCRENDLALICDEVFADYAFGPDPRRLETLAGAEEVLTFSLSGLSKVVGLPQMKLGWMVVSGPKSLRAEALERIELIADTYLSVGTPVMCAAPRLLDLAPRFQQRLMSRLHSNLGTLKESLARAPEIEVLYVEGGWYATLRVPRTRSEEEWALALLEQGVLVQPGYFYDFESEAYLVLSLLTDPAVFAEGLGRLAGLITEERPDRGLC
ncbi:MAG: pyridoxal phosphate-dependent aminotransferase [Bryobacteraceae bacterium]|nr:pyridoxal phosphate-dependent aminotransferase [Bryobacteraceae bacterium]